MSLYLCVDCGGSNTSVVVCDAQGEVIGSARGGPSNYAYLSHDAYISAVESTVSNALKTCVNPRSFEPVALPPSSPLFAAAWFGVSGVDSPQAIEVITPSLSKLLGIPEGPNLVVGNDTQLLAAPLRMHPDITYAVTVVAGTGSIAVSFAKVYGELVELGRVGGWGWILGDEGGGFHVGRETIRQILMAHDNSSVMSIPSPASRLTPRVLDFFGVTSIPELLNAVHSPDYTMGKGQLPREKRLSTLAPTVFVTAFEEGDALALNILRTCARLLASEISILLGNANEVYPRLVTAGESLISFGGSLSSIAKYRQLILDELALQGHIFRDVVLLSNAAEVGAKALAASYNQ